MPAAASSSASAPNSASMTAAKRRGAMELSTKSCIALMTYTGWSLSTAATACRKRAPIPAMGKLVRTARNWGGLERLLHRDIDGRLRGQVKRLVLRGFDDAHYLPPDFLALVPIDADAFPERVFVRPEPPCGEVVDHRCLQAAGGIVLRQFAAGQERDPHGG